ncbi:aBC-type metal ion transport system periplasmic component/surface adhesin [Roseburia sp. CAG:182]|nr:aBC-type metal ion transport system periplasmic component/surface adhesin [Roseburia sp. CAG:182]
MKNKYVFVTVMLAVLLFLGVGLTEIYVNHTEKKEDGQYTVVTSFYPMYIAALNVVGENDHIRLENLSEPQTGCLHDYQLTPADMQLLSTADAFIINGGGIESFLGEVAEQYPDLTIINASEQVDLIEDNAHAWMNIEAYMTQVKTIEAELSAADPADTEQFSENADAYLAKLSSLKEQADAVKPLTEGKNIVIFHEAYEYVAEEFGMQVSYVMDLDEERQVSAGEVADVVRTVTDGGVRVILAEELYGKDMGDTVESETDAKICYLDTLVRGDYDADSYLNAMQQNITLLKEAFSDEKDH